MTTTHLGCSGPVPEARALREARHLLDDLGVLSLSVPRLERPVGQLAAALDPAPLDAPAPGAHVLVCSGCGNAVDAADLQWWPRLPGSRALLRVGCASCVASAQAGGWS